MSKNLNSQELKPDQPNDQPPAESQTAVKREADTRSSVETGLSKDTAFVAAPRAIEVIFDPGNRSILLYDGKNLVKLASLYAWLSGNRKPIRMNDQSSVVEIHTSDGSSEYNGTRYLIGEAASRQPRYERVYNRPKFDECLLYLLPCIGKLFPKQKDLTLAVKVNATEAELHQNLLEQKLKGKTEATLDGRDISLTVESVTVFEEGLGAWYLLNDSEPQIKGHYTGVLNLGGATIDSILVDYDGYVLTEASLRSPKGGTFDLATEIRRVITADRADMAYLEADVIMNCLEFNDYVIDGYDFSSIVRNEIDNWFKSVMGKTQAVWSSYFHKISRYILTGGSAYLVIDKAARSPKFHVTRNPVYDNVIGLYGRQKINS
ncbi:ParM/StbA family protein [Anabaenopsis elenkinii]|uniref:ParM/StbA family protein n=1 Tax=Anabaenopsis elenkinii CCIBt3563 TaxID=2779889 RepID=A0A7S6RE35_9CYAN|nr:ParM/StbA family protein [Anabaenopsis elenkinii]QOV22682.1 ParM/StbA family protein [Anabaenopsis elenkinii CCIBt3563]